MAEKKNSKRIHIALWVAQGLFAALFIMAGAVKVFQPIDELVTSLDWVTSVPLEMVRLIGIAEVLGGLGLLLPALLRIKPALTVWAALGLVVVMLSAAVFHASRGEYLGICVCLLMAATAGFIAWGRGIKAPILAK